MPDFSHFLRRTGVMVRHFLIFFSNLSSNFSRPRRTGILEHKNPAVSTKKGMPICQHPLVLSGFYLSFMNRPSPRWRLLPLLPSGQWSV
jgi:hypothetical protein